jgi:zinc/manganese transport system substrate-binding protein
MILSINTGGLGMQAMRRARGNFPRRVLALASGLAFGATMLMGFVGARAASVAAPRVVQMVGAENEYANVAQQIGGAYVHTVALMNNPNTDPHTFEASPTDAKWVGSAELVVQNGVGYDSFMNELENATPNSKRIVITAATVLGLGSHTKNPHLFYKPGEMAAVAGAITQALNRLEPSHTRYFEARLKTFDQSLTPWRRAIAQLNRAYHGTPVAVTEPVADYMLNAAGLRILTPWSFQAAVMNSVDPSPQASAIEKNLLVDHKVRVFVYNQQAVDATTEAMLAAAEKAKIPVVGVYETMPPGHDYQSWMTDETRDIIDALRYHRSYRTL